MPIAEDQLVTWSHQGSITQSSETYRAVRDALTASDTPYAGRDVEVFLQGSYGNDTNIWAESDVDIVMVLNACWQSDLSDLSEQAQAAYRASFVSATYGYAAFKRDVCQVLVDRFGRAVQAGAKAIAIDAQGNRRKADVIVAIQYRRYERFLDPDDQSFAQGICFWNHAGQRIPNFPKQHAAHLTTKHQATHARLKPLIRVVKNLRSQLIEQGYLKSGVAPSYYLEGLMYNLPEGCFAGTFQDQMTASLAWLRDQGSGTELVCPNRQFYLVRDGALTCWPTDDFRAFLAAATRRWEGLRPWVSLL